MTTFSKTPTVADTRYEQEKNFDPVAYSEEVMKTVGADFHEDDPVFQTNEFRMHCYKILPCSKHFCHDWSVCPFAHFSERAKRRDPKEVKYTAIACPDMKKGEDCPRGDRCPYSHNTFEYWLHPTRYRTRLCRDHEACNRKICFFAHKPEEVRVPTSRPSLPVSEEAWPGDAVPSKEDKEMESLTRGLAMSSHNEAQAKQASQLQAFLQGQNLHVNTTTAKAEPTFVDQVLNGMLPSSGMSTMSLEEMQNLQIAQAAQNLPFDSYFQSPGLQQGAMHPMSTNNGCFPTYDGFQSFGPTPMNAFSNPASQLPIVTESLARNPMHHLSFPPGPVAAKAQPQPDLAEMIQLLSNMQVVGSPTSVLAQRHMNQGGLMQHSLSVDDGTSSAMGLGDAEVDNMQLANALMGLNGTGASHTGEPASTLFGISL